MYGAKTNGFLANIAHIKQPKALAKQTARNAALYGIPIPDKILGIIISIYDIAKYTLTTALNSPKTDMFLFLFLILL